MYVGTCILNGPNNSVRYVRLAITGRKRRLETVKRHTLSPIPRFNCRPFLIKWPFNVYGQIEGLNPLGNSKLNLYKYPDMKEKSGSILPWSFSRERKIISSASVTNRLLVASYRINMYEDDRNCNFISESSLVNLIERFVWCFN